MLTRQTSNAHEDFRALTRALDAELNARYGAMQAAYDRHNVIDPIETALVGYESSTPMACGCFKIIDAQTVEIKRMFVMPAYRRRGFSSRILAELESWACTLGYQRARLETGKSQPEAIALYRKCGYEVVENFPPYVGMDDSVCMQKSLRSNDG
ncbi:MAG: GNAT family N-acetyltransferase [Sulfurospirillum cavolei]|nr:GNAT family N-acetyltransferase [Sulfurospirillum cavolei]